MAVTLEELQLKFKSEIAAVTSKDEAALARVDASVRQSQASLGKLQQAHKATAQAAQAAALEQKIAESALAGAKPEERAARAAEAKRAQAAAARAVAKEEAIAAKLAAASKQHEDLSAGAPELVALAKRKHAILAEAAAAKRAAAEKASAEKSSAAERSAIAKAAEVEKAAAAKRAAAEQTANAKRVAAEERAAAKVSAAKSKTAAAEQAATAKRVAAEQTAATKKQADAVKALQKARDAASEEASASRIEASRAAMAGAAGAALALGAALLAAGGAAVVFGLGAAGAARDARILADALTGSAALGGEFSAVVSQLASKVPMAKGAIADLARELNLMKLGRRDMQAGLTAIAITTSAIGESAGNVIKGVVQSSAAMRRFSLGARDMWGEYQGLAGSGLKKADVLSALAKQLGISAREAERQLMLGRVKLKDGLRALEAATQARFGKTIAAQMLSANTQFEKAKENLAGMFSGVDLEPALGGLKDLLSIFDENTVAGAMLKTLLQVGFGGLSQTLGVLLPLGKAFFLEMMIGALEMYLALRPIARQIRDWIEPLLTAENAAMAGKIAVYALAAAFGLVAVAALAAVAVITLPFAVAAAAVWLLVTAVQSAWDWLANDAGEAAANLVDSFVGMLSAGVDRAINAAKDLANRTAEAFKGALGIASPSKVFAAYGRYTVQGFAEGVDDEAGAAQGAVDGMAPTAPGGGTAGAGGALRLGGGTTVNLTMGDVYFAGQRATPQEKGDLEDFLKEKLQAAINAVGAGQPLGAT